eukprot:TRINITY_DN32505_c0_g1_i1.p1 TRINITY_DN32505_c0_g1~~TRINITY_DN32505_c0_g1_i1.p1  ORF type:complete len:432 (+),score=149.55 TRINITY_DN32505_c0_g1_i1:67-1296(+)
MPKTETVISEAPNAASWDQRETLRPPPFQGPLKRLLAGLETADPEFDELPFETLARGVHDPSVLPDRPDPEWADWEQVRRGQELWGGKHLSAAFLALAGALQQGFSIARFSEVLKDTGYNSSPHTTFDRFLMTGYHVMDWWRFPLNDPSSHARKSIRTVRAMHAMARKKAIKRGVLDSGAGEGVPLSQYDLAEVLMGFGIICLNLMEELLGRDTTRSEKADMLSVMRVVGWHLGVDDEYNTCVNLDEADSMYDEYMSYTPQRFRTCRESTHDLQYNVAAGFGETLPLGKQFWFGFTVNTSKARQLEVDYVRLRTLPGVLSWVETLTDAFRHDTVVALVSKGLVMERELFRTNPAEVRRRHRITAKIAAFSDKVTWPLLSKVSVATAGRIARITCVVLLLFLLQKLKRYF